MFLLRRVLLAHAEAFRIHFKVVFICESELLISSKPFAEVVAELFGT